MKTYFALLPILTNISMIGMEIKDTGIQHIEPIRYQFNALELCTQPCTCPSRLGSIDNFGHIPSPVKPAITQAYTFNMEGFDKLPLESLEYIFRSGMNYHAGKENLWHFHKQFLIPLVMAIKKKKEEKQTYISDTTLQQFSILLRDLLIAQEDDLKLLSILFKAGAQPNYPVNDPEVTGDLSTKPVFFFARTVSLLEYCVKNHATLTRVDNKGNTILHEIVDDVSLSVEQKKALLSFCLRRGIFDQHNDSGKTAADICSFIAGQRKGDEQQKWYGLVDLLLKSIPRKKSKPEVSEQTSSPMPSSEPIPIPESKLKQRSSWWWWN